MDNQAKFPKNKKGNYYQKVLTDSQKMEVELAAGVEGIDDEITLLRLKIKSMLKDDPDNLIGVLLITGMLAKLVKIKNTISGDRKKGLADAIQNVMKDFVLPLGIATITKKP